MCAKYNQGKINLNVKRGFGNSTKRGKRIRSCLYVLRNMRIIGKVAINVLRVLSIPSPIPIRVHTHFIYEGMGDFLYLTETYIEGNGGRHLGQGFNKG